MNGRRRAEGGGTGAEERTAKSGGRGRRSGGTPERRADAGVLKTGERVVVLRPPSPAPFPVPLAPHASRPTLLEIRQAFSRRATTQQITDHVSHT